MKRREMIRPRRSNGSSPRGPARRIQGAVSRRHGRGAQSSLRDREPSKSPGILNESRSRRFWMRLAKKRQTIVVSRLEGGGGGESSGLTWPSLSPPPFHGWGCSSLVPHANIAAANPNPRSLCCILFLPRSSGVPLALENLLLSSSLRPHAPPLAFKFRKVKFTAYSMARIPMARARLESRLIFHRLPRVVPSSSWEEAAVAVTKRISRKGFSKRVLFEFFPPFFFLLPLSFDRLSATVSAN